MTRTTAQRGLGTDHQKLRAAALTALADGDPCARCAQRGIYHPMTRDAVTWKDGRPSSRWLDLDDFPGRAFGGPQVKRLSWRKCNRSAGGRLGGRITAAKRQALTMATSRRW
jgi:hypothetical protein